MVHLTEGIVYWHAANHIPGCECEGFLPLYNTGPINNNTIVSSMFTNAQSAQDRAGSRGIARRPCGIARDRAETARGPGGERAYTYIHTYIHTHIYIYIYIYGPVRQVNEYIYGQVRQVNELLSENLPNTKKSKN